jgi:hypothetical protein
MAPTRNAHTDSVPIPAATSTSTMKMPSTGAMLLKVLARAPGRPMAPLRSVTSWSAAACSDGARVMTAPAGRGGCDGKGV